MLKIFWWRVVFLLFFIVFELSFTSILFPESRVPSLLFNLAIALVLVRGFRQSAWEWLFVFIAYDLLRSGGLTLLTPLGVLIAYGASFVSRRFIFEHRGSNLIILSFLGSGSSLLYALTIILTLKFPLKLTLLSQDALFGFITFIPVFLVVQWFEQRSEAVQLSEFRGMRH